MSRKTKFRTKTPRPTPPPKPTRSHRDVASDFFALRKHYTGSKWLFTEGINPLNAASHCDIAWAGGLATKANRIYRDVGGAVA